MKSDKFNPNDPLPLDPGRVPEPGRGVYLQVAPRIVHLGLKGWDRPNFAVWCAMVSVVRDLHRTGAESVLVAELEEWRKMLSIPKEIQDEVINS